MRVCICTCLCVYVRACVYMYVCVCVVQCDFVLLFLMHSVHVIFVFSIAKSTGNTNASYSAQAHHNSSRSIVPVVTPTAVHPMTSHAGLNHSNSNNDVIIIPSLQPAHVTYVNKTPQSSNHNQMRPHHDLSHAAPNSNHIQKDIVLVQQQPTNQIQSPVVTMIPLDSSKVKVANPMAPDIVAISSPTHSRLYTEPASSS